MEEGNTGSSSRRKKGAHLVLVHGLGSGAWCWYKVRCLLEASGYKVTCVDLKSAGIDPSLPDSVHSFHDYNQPLLHFFSQFSSSQDSNSDPSSTHYDGKVILVGHSAGGLSVTEATYWFPDKIHAAVYVAATMLQHGFSTPQDMIDGVPEIVRLSGSGPNETSDTTDDTEFQRQMNYHMSPHEDVTLAMMLRRPGPINALRGAKFSGGNMDAERVPRVYIKTMQDRILKPEQQEAMIKRWPPSHVFLLDSDHNPSFSAPFLLSAFLINIAECFIK